MAWVATTYAFRSLGRHRRRTALSIVGIGVGCALALFMESMNRGRDELFARMGALAGAGHVRVVPAGWRERRDVRLRLADWSQDLEAARALPGVAVATGRARAQVLLAMGTHVVPVEMVGVDPEVEPRANRLVRTMHRGRYLDPSATGTVVLGRGVADRLQADVDDEIMATAVSQGGDIASIMLRIVGLVSTGSEEVDASICQVAMPDVERLTGLRGAGEVTLVLDNWRAADEMRARLGPAVARGDEALTWGEISPAFKGHLEQDKAMSRAVSLIILLIVLLGVASAQLAAVLERRREFAVLAALGMRTRTMVGLVVQEALSIGVGGALLGLAIGLPLIWRLATVGLDLRGLMGGSYTFQGVIVEPVIYGDVGSWSASYVFGVAIVATLLASLYPAWFASRTDPADALRVAQ